MIPPFSTAFGGCDGGGRRAGVSESPEKRWVWRVDKTLVDLSPGRAVSFFAWNAQSFVGRWARRIPAEVLAPLVPMAEVAEPGLGLRLLHTVLRGVSRDRLDLLGEEYFEYELKPQMKPEGVRRAGGWLKVHPELILATDALEQVARPLARHLGFRHVLANRMEFRDGIATGRLHDPVIPARETARNGDPAPLWSLQDAGRYARAILLAERTPVLPAHSVVRFNSADPRQELSVRRSLAGRTMLVVGATGFIGKVWLANLLTDLPEIRKIYLLIRRQKSTPAVRRFEKMVEESPVFHHLHERHGANLGRYLGERIEVLDGDITQPGLGLAAAARARLAGELDIIVNSAGLTDFNPDIRDALAINVDGIVNLIEFQRSMDQAALLHLSTCFTVGFRDGRIDEEWRPNYTPRGTPGFDVEQERQFLHRRVAEILKQSESEDVTRDLREQAHRKGHNLPESAIENHVRRYRARWVRNQMIEAGMKRARELHWPNTYCYTKSLGESLIAAHAGNLPHSIVRPSITETSLRQPFRGWNEGVNTSAPLSYLLGTHFRQLPSNPRKYLDLIPVDLVARGMTLIAAALAERRHHRLYHLATSGCNPCNMRRSIELTCLAHRKFYRAQNDSALWLKARFDTIPVSKERYRAFSAPAQKAIVQGLRKLTSPVAFASAPLVRAERELERLEKLIELYEPFILLNEHCFEARNIELLSAALPEAERPQFAYDAHEIDWWEYWINLHVPALRRWTYPLIEGRPIENLRRREFRLRPA
jgi:long-chain acyl-CoA synthetase